MSIEYDMVIVVHAVTIMVRSLLPISNHRTTLYAMSATALSLALTSTLSSHDPLLYSCPWLAL